LEFKILYYLGLLFSISQRIPIVGRLVDVATALLVMLLRCASGEFVAAGIDQCRRPTKTLKLYEFEGCPFCKKVRETICVLNLDVLVYPCPRETLKAYGVCEKSRFRPEVSRLGGSQQFPFLVDENTNAKMHGSDEISQYLWRTYGNAAKPPLTYTIAQALNKTPLLLVTGLCRPLTSHGILRVPSKAPAQPLELWGHEASPFVKLVREALCVLELPYLMRTCGIGADVKRAEFRQKYGDQLSSLRRAGGAKLNIVQIPLLVDPNTSTVLLESADIVAYLYRTYQDGEPSQETWLDFSSAGKPERAATAKKAVKAE
jgi:glutathione S-transferase